MIREANLKSSLYYFTYNKTFCIGEIWCWFRHFRLKLLCFEISESTNTDNYFSKVLFFIGTICFLFAVLIAALILEVSQNLIFL